MPEGNQQMLQQVQVWPKLFLTRYPQLPMASLVWIQPRAIKQRIWWVLRWSRIRILSNSQTLIQCLYKTQVPIQLSGKFSKSLVNPKCLTMKEGLLNQQPSSTRNPKRMSTSKDSVYSNKPMVQNNQQAISPSKSRPTPKLFTTNWSNSNLRNQKLWQLRTVRRSSSKKECLLKLFINKTANLLLKTKSRKRNPCLHTITTTIIKPSNKQWLTTTHPTRSLFNPTQAWPKTNAVYCSSNHALTKWLNNNTPLISWLRSQGKGRRNGLLIKRMDRGNPHPCLITSKAKKKDPHRVKTLTR